METMKGEQIRNVVEERYRRLAESFAAEDSGTADCGCADSDCCVSAVTLYESDTSTLPATITAFSLGCGDPLILAELQPRQTVLDLGSGGGMDCFLAAERVGDSGHVIGVDMTPAMLAKAAANQRQLGLKNVEFRRGHIEALPVEDNSVDVVISNCVINLSPDKEAVFREVFRVLRPGGRLAVSDMVTQGRFSAEERADLAAWADCISGAEEVADYVSWMRAAGFTEISIRDRGAPEVELAGTISLQAAPRLFSARIQARKPES